MLLMLRPAVSLKSRPCRVVMMATTETRQGIQLSTSWSIHNSLMIKSISDSAVFTVRKGCALVQRSDKPDGLAYHYAMQMAQPEQLDQARYPNYKLHRLIR